MGVLEAILLSVLAGGILLALILVLFSRGKKKEAEAKKEEPAETPKVEPVYKKKGQEVVQKKEETIEEQRAAASLKIIRKQSEIKINKKALQGDSRNPSITRVFVKGKRVDEQPEELEKALEPPTNSKVMSDITDNDVGHYGTREPIFSPSLEDRSGERSPFEMPNRAPIIGDRTNFTNRLHVSEDNNLSGVSGTGIAKALKENEEKMSDIDQKTENMVDDIRKNILGQKNPYYEDFDEQPKAPPADLKNIDAKTLIIADMINGRKTTKK